MGRPPKDDSPTEYKGIPIEDWLLNAPRWLQGDKEPTWTLSSGPLYDDVKLYNEPVANNLNEEGKAKILRHLPPRGYLHNCKWMALVASSKLTAKDREERWPLQYQQRTPVGKFWFPFGEPSTVGNSYKIIFGNVQLIGDVHPDLRFRLDSKPHVNHTSMTGSQIEERFRMDYNYSAMTKEEQTRRATRPDKPGPDTRQRLFIQTKTYVPMTDPTTAVAPTTEQYTASTTHVTDTIQSANNLKRANDYQDPPTISVDDFDAPNIAPPFAKRARLIPPITIPPVVAPESRNLEERVTVLEEALRSLTNHVNSSVAHTVTPGTDKRLAEASQTNSSGTDTSKKLAESEQKVAVLTNTANAFHRLYKGATVMASVMAHPNCSQDQVRRDYYHTLTAATRHGGKAIVTALDDTFPDLSKQIQATTKTALADLARQIPPNNGTTDFVPLRETFDLSFLDDGISFAQKDWYQLKQTSRDV